ncbi:F-box/kelch-repeat protein At3g61590 [Striga asiatica]|uniref:F-box/kelch-repeat protein At3g61590 n=1 Tax=Striga asiatica TaxID=4170 RepID=A0A5A7PQI4_STRAF|nr:F-box/kelch-repeat protein At3g61590 [Striga asiatica]
MVKTSMLGRPPSPQSNKETNSSGTKIRRSQKLSSAFQSLPDELLRKILLYLPEAQDIYRTGLTCRGCYRIIRSLEIVILASFVGMSSVPVLESDAYLTAKCNSRWWVGKVCQTAGKPSWLIKTSGCFVMWFVCDDYFRKKVRTEERGCNCELMGLVEINELKWGQASYLRQSWTELCTGSLHLLPVTEAFFRTPLVKSNSKNQRSNGPKLRPTTFHPSPTHLPCPARMLPNSSSQTRTRPSPHSPSQALQQHTQPAPFSSSTQTSGLGPAKSFLSAAQHTVEPFSYGSLSLSGSIPEVLLSSPEISKMSEDHKYALIGKFSFSKPSNEAI